MAPADELHERVQMGGCVDHAGTGILPAQYIAQRQGAHQPLRRLMIAMLEDAIRTFQRYLFTQSKSGRRLFSEAEAWLLDEGRDVPLRFADVCVLELDAAFLRRALRSWRERARANASVTAAPARGNVPAQPGWVPRLETARRQRPLAAPHLRRRASRPLA